MKISHVKGSTHTWTKNFHHYFILIQYFRNVEAETTTDKKLKYFIFKKHKKTEKKLEKKKKSAKSLGAERCTYLHKLMMVL